MEHINKVELRGRVGSASETKIGDLILVKLTVATNYVYKSKDDQAVIETTWHYVEKFCKESPDIKKGDSVYVLGRLRTQRYTDINGNEKVQCIVFARKLLKIDDNEQFNPEYDETFEK